MDTAALPRREVTADQVVALNIRHWRTAAGMTQEELGQRLGWSAANVSAAERSAAEGRERRRFDAQALAEIALALGVPLAALFLPPPDDGTSARYVITARDGREYGMGEVASLLVMPDSGADSKVMGEYRDRLAAVATRYLTPERAVRAEAWLADPPPPDVRAGLAGRLRDREMAQALLRASDELRQIHASLMREPG